MKFLNKDNFICIHDMLPRNWVEANYVAISSGPWLGNVSKVASELIETDHIEFKIAKIDYGIGVLKVKNSKARLRDFQNELKSKKFSYHLINNIRKILIIKWTDAQAWLKT